MTYGYMSDDGRRYGAMLRGGASTAGMSVVHAEDDAIANWLTAKYVREGKTHGAYISETRGPLVEEAAVRRAMLLAERAGSPLYVLHIAAGTAVDALAEGRARGPAVLRRDDRRPTSPSRTRTSGTRRRSKSNGKTYQGPRGLLYNNFPTVKFEEDREALWERDRRRPSAGRRAPTTA